MHNKTHEPEQIRESEMRYRRLFEAARDGILILNAETGKIEDANPFMTELLGYDHAQLVGKQLWEIGLFQDIEESKRAFAKLQETGYIRYEDLPLESEGRQRREVEFVSNVYPVGDHKAIQCNIRDITQRKKLEREVAEQAAKLAEFSRRKDEFLAMLSHELRNPLAPIMSAVQILRLQGGENPVQIEAREVIERQVRHLVRLVNDLLEVSRVTTGRIQLRLERVSLNSVVGQAIETWQAMIDRHKQKLSVSIPKEIILMDADATRLEQVVGNLLNNAIKYTGKNGQIGVALEREGHEAVIRVKDTGIGIEPMLLKNVFDLFTQADKSLERAEGGLGIGLALVKSLTEMHGGTVEAHSRLHEGSEFVVRLPVQPPLPASHALPEPAAVTCERCGEPRPLRILVVDDNVAVARMSAVLLRTLGYDVKASHSGMAALELAVSFKPQVVLLDIGMPEMDGYEVARRFRAHPDLKDVRLVAVTGYGQESDRLRSKEAGFNNHLVKPVEVEELLEAVAC